MVSFCSFRSETRDPAILKSVQDELKKHVIWIQDNKMIKRIILFVKLEILVAIATKENCTPTIT